MDTRKPTILDVLLNTPDKYPGDEVFNKYFKENGHLTITDKDGRTALMVAAQHKNVGAVKWLLRSHFRFEFKPHHTSNVKTLCSAPTSAQTEVESKSTDDKLTTSVRHYSALTFAIDHPTLNSYESKKEYADPTEQCMKMLIDAGAPIRDDDIIVAIRAGNLWFLTYYFQEIVHKSKHALESFSTEGHWEEALNFAIQHGKSDVVKCLLREKTQFTPEHQEHWNIALSFAVQCGQENALHAILDEKKALKASFRISEALLGNLIAAYEQQRFSIETAFSLIRILFDKAAQNSSRVFVTFCENNKLIRLAIENSNYPLIEKMLAVVSPMPAKKLEFLGVAALITASAYRDGKLSEDNAKERVLFFKKQNNDSYKDTFKNEENYAIMKRLNLAEALIAKNDTQAAVIYKSIKPFSTGSTNNALGSQLAESLSKPPQQPKKETAQQNDDTQPAKRSLAFTTLANPSQQSTSEAKKQTIETPPPAVPHSAALPPVTNPFMTFKETSIKPDAKNFSTFTELYHSAQKKDLWTNNPPLAASLKAYALQQMTEIAKTNPFYQAELNVLLNPQPKPAVGFTKTG